MFKPIFVSTLFFLACCIGILTITSSSFALDEPVVRNTGNLHGVTIAKLVFEIDGTQSALIDKNGIRIEILEELLENGFNALGNKNLAFGEDSSKSARFILGGTVNELNCNNNYSSQTCRLMMTWELLDTAKEAIVYKVETNAVDHDINSSNRAIKLKGLIKATLQSLIRRDKFSEFLTKKEDDSQDESVNSYNSDAASFLECEDKNYKMPQDAESILDVTVLLESDNGFGSGVIVSPDGFILTAAHVVPSNQINVVFRGGRESTAKLIRLDRSKDVALLKMEGTGFECLSIAPKQSSVGNRIFAIGAPASRELSFSLTSGIVSAFRNWKDDQFLQTDASINPGNSGGPMINENGQLVAIVSWKIARAGYEGIGFGIPAIVALKALSISSSKRTDDALTKTTQIAAANSQIDTYVDSADPFQSIFDIKDITLAQRKEHAKWYYNLTKGTGVVLLLLSPVFVGTTYLLAKFKDTDLNGYYTYEEYNRLKSLNTFGWALAGSGAALYALSFFFLPSKKSVMKQYEQAKYSREFRIGMSFNQVNLEVRF